jgi:MarR family transcriptional regulator, transcriptional regulator for hemolysin
LPPGRSVAARGDAQRLRALVQTFVRSFGLLVTKQTPCGQPISPSYAHALMVLLERSRETTDTSQAELALTLGIDKSNVTRLCSRMEAAGHVVQERAPEDGRSRLVTLTPHGARLAGRVEDASQQRFARIMAALTPNERSVMLDSLAALNRAIGTLDTERTES